MGHEMPDVSGSVEKDVILDQEIETSVVESVPEEINSTGDAPEKKSSILYSEYEKGVRLPMSLEDANDVYQARRAEIIKEQKDALVSPVEQVFKGRLGKTKEEFHVDEIIDTSRAKLREALSGIVEATGTGADSLIQGVGGILVEGVARQMDSRLSDALGKIITKGMSGDERQALGVVSSKMNAENMMFTQELGGNDKGWKLTIGADPGGILGSRGGDPKVGVMFRMVMP